MFFLAVAVLCCCNKEAGSSFFFIILHVRQPGNGTNQGNITVQQQQTSVVLFSQNYTNDRRLQPNCGVEHRVINWQAIGSNVENLRVGGNQECEDTDPSSSFFF